MNRTIKFRAWNKKERRWYKGGAVQLTALLGNSFGLSEPNGKIIELSQYTGIKDIYEGDVVAHDGHRLEVRWFHNGWFGSDALMTVNAVEFKDDEVIGNVHEHPELLTKE
jgi:hypothetical protein